MRLRDLTWGDLHKWAGPRIVERGKGYMGVVADSRQTAYDRLFARLQGGQRYATVVAVAASGTLVSS